VVCRLECVSSLRFLHVAYALVHVVDLFQRPFLGKEFTMYLQYVWKRVIYDSAFADDLAMK
jgi:hypothetical protein